MLQHVGESLDVIIDRTPICHPEMAGEGIEYSWDIAKTIYRIMPYKLKKTKKSFLECVDKALNPDVSLTIDKVRRCSRKARDYIVACYNLHQTQDERENDEILHKASSHLDIEKIVKQRKCHREALSCECSFVTYLFNNK